MKKQTPPLVKPSVSAEELADSIQAIATTMRSLFQSRLSRKAIEALIYQHSGVSKSAISTVLNNLESFDEIWLKKKPKEK